jgi:hypothetical protein
MTRSSSRRDGRTSDDQPGADEAGTAGAAVRPDRRSGSARPIAQEGTADRSGRWTADAALALARRHGLWTPQEGGNSDNVVIRSAAALSDDIGRLVERVGTHEFTRDERLARVAEPIAA